MSLRQTSAALSLPLMCGNAALADDQGAGKRLTLSTSSREAKDVLAQLQKRIESLQFGNDNKRLLGRGTATATCTAGKRPGAAKEPGSFTPTVLEEALLLEQQLTVGPAMR